LLLPGTRRAEPEVQEPDRRAILWTVCFNV
jgi:hypothetical protein